MKDCDKCLEEESYKVPDKKLIFLDVDGVLNNSDNIIKTHDSMSKEEYLELLHKEITPFDKKSLKYLGKLIDKFEGEVIIVVSSTWRLSQKSLEILRYKIEDYIHSWNVRFDKTGRDDHVLRGKEIDKYFKDHKYIRQNYVIIDDDDFDIIDRPDLKIPPYNYHFVKCSNKTGFKYKEYRRALKILRGDKVEPYRRNI